MAKDPHLYDAISTSYADTRRPDPRIAKWIHGALGGALNVVNVGAGTGNYEPTDRRVVAVEPSRKMITGRPAGSAPVIQASAEHLPFRPREFDASMAVLTVHHWRDWRNGLAEMSRVAARQVIYLFEPAMINRFWAMKGNYWPEAFQLPSEEEAIGAQQVAEVLNVTQIGTIPIPIDCTDGFGAAFWGRPEAYLDPQIQQGMSWLAQLPRDVLARGAARLEGELRSGEWDRHHGHLRQLDELDVGHRLITAGI
jgi:SAM-dependent methyltransferase